MVVQTVIRLLAGCILLCIFAVSERITGKGGEDTGSFIAAGGIDHTEAGSPSEARSG